jgi:hypothetical protein
LWSFLKETTVHNMKMVLDCEASIRTQTRGGPEKFALRPNEYGMKKMLQTLEEVQFIAQRKRPRLV